MKTKFIFLTTFFMFGLFFASCDRDQATLNDIAGDWEITNVEIILTNGDFLENDLEGTPLSFNACDTKQNDSADRCDFTVGSDQDGTAIFLKYNVVRVPGVDGRVVQVWGTERNTAATGQTLLYQVMDQNFKQEVSRSELTLSTDSETTNIRIMNEEVQSLTVTARRP